MGSTITGCGKATPGDELTTKQLASLLDVDEDWILERTGIISRRIATSDQTTATLATEACADALADAALAPADIDMVIAATCSPDNQLPGVAPAVQHALGAASTGAFDVNVGCAGFIYGLAIADSLIQAQLAQRVLLCGAEVLSRVTNYADLKSCVLFGDGAGAVVIEGVPGRGSLGPFTLAADGSGTPLLRIPYPSRLIEMDGRAIYRHAVDTMATSVRELLEMAGCRPEEVALLVAHQANGRILSAVAERVGLSDRALVNIERWGNTSAASIPLALVEASRAGRMAPGDLVVLTAFGAGFAWGSALTRWSASVSQTPAPAVVAAADAPVS